MEDEFDGFEEEVINSELVKNAVKLEARNVAARRKQAIADANADAEIAQAAAMLETLIRDPKVPPAELDKYLQKALAAQRAKSRR